MGNCQLSFRSLFSPVKGKLGVGGSPKAKKNENKNIWAISFLWNACGRSFNGTSEKFFEGRDAGGGCVFVCVGGEGGS